MVITIILLIEPKVLHGQVMLVQIPDTRDIFRILFVICPTQLADSYLSFSISTLC